MSVPELFIVLSRQLAFAKRAVQLGDQARFSALLQLLKPKFSHSYRLYRFILHVRNYAKKHSLPNLQIYSRDRSRIDLLQRRRNARLLRRSGGQRNEFLLWLPCTR